MLEQLNAQVRSCNKRRLRALSGDPERGFGLTSVMRCAASCCRPCLGRRSRPCESSASTTSSPPFRGVKEDTTELLLNIKQLRPKSHSDQPGHAAPEAQGLGVVTAADLIYPPRSRSPTPSCTSPPDSPDARLAEMPRWRWLLGLDGANPCLVVPSTLSSRPSDVNYTVDNARRRAHRPDRPSSTSGPMAPSPRAAALCNRRTS